MFEAAAKALMLFDRYVEMSPAELSRALMDLQRQDESLYSALVRLLAADEQTHSFVSPLAWFAGHSASAIDEQQVASRIWPDGTRIGPWCVDGVIGLGGMGVVYAAHRADNLYEREVALKTIRTEIMSPMLQQAFAKERSHLAKLDHPCIVSLYDAGIADGGQPWLAMQRVHGDPIDVWCDTRNADLRTRVKLLVETCDAIAYAHAHGVLHQDIKPSNLLVTEDGSVKLLDFGLSAIITSQAEGGFSRVGVSSGYAAPEVFAGAPPSVTIDVYALGVVLYRLLCDHWPRKPDPAAGLPQVRDDDVPHPSRLVAGAGDACAHKRGARDVQVLIRALSGDLDAIAKRAVRDDPVERYASIGAFRADLQAWLDRRPVMAWAYRSSRFVRRNARMVCAAALLLSILTGVVAMEWRHQERIRLEAENGQILSRMFDESLGVATLTSLGTAPLSSHALLTDTERRLREQAGTGRPLFLARGLTTLSRAQLIGGNYDKAAQLAKEAKALGSGSALQLARADAVLAQLSNMRVRYVDAERFVRDGLAMVPSQGNVDDALVRLDLQMQLSRVCWGRGDPDSAFAVLDAALKSAEALGDNGRPALAELLGQRGYMRGQLFRLADADVDLRRALVVLGDRSPTIQSALRRYLVNVLILSGRNEEAGREAAAVLGANLRIFGASHPETGRAWISVGKASFYLRDSEASRDAVAQGMRILEQQIGAAHPDLAEAIVIRGGLAFEAGDLPAVLSNARLAVGILEGAYGPRHEATLKRRADLALILLRNAEHADSVQQEVFYREAEALLSDAIEQGHRQGLPMGYARDEYADVLLHFGRLSDAESQTHIAISEMSSLFGADSDYVLPAYMSLMKVSTAHGRYDETVAIGSRLLTKTESEDKSSYTRFLVLDLLLANEIARGDPARIRHAYGEAERLAQRHGFMRMLERRRGPGIAPGRRH